MEDLAARFRREARGRSSLRYSREIRELAAEYCRQARGQGHSWARIAVALGASESSVRRWFGGRVASRVAQSSAVHEVVLVEPVGEDRPVLVLPSGVRVEGLTVRGLVAVLEALG